MQIFQEVIVPLKGFDRKVKTIGWVIDCPSVGSERDIISPNIQVRIHDLHIWYLNRIVLDLTEFILGFLIPAVSQFPYDLVNTWHGIPLEEIMTGKIVEYHS